MNYSDFVNEALCRGFEHPERLYMVAYKLDMLEVYTLCTEEESIWPGIYEYHINGKIFYILTEHEACRIVDNYRRMLASKLADQSIDNAITRITDEEMAAAYYNDIFDVFDVVQEVELELDGILFPKYGSLVTGGAIGDGLFFFCSGFTLFMGRQDGFPNWYKRRINRIYPTIIMWALVSAVIFNWNWQITDLITTPKYWFIPCIMAYYVIFYFIRTYLLKYLNQVFGIAFLLVAISSFWVLDFNHSVMYAAVPFMRIYYFLFMMLGAMVAIRKYKVVSPLKSGGYALVSLITYYVLMGIYKIDPFFCKFQLISLIPLLSSIYWIYRFCDTPQIYKILEYKSGGKFIYFISTLTLEIYMVQYAIFTDKLNNIFPLNIIIIYIIIFIAAYLLKCTAHLFSQVFSNEPFNNKSIYQV